MSKVRPVVTRYARYVVRGYTTPPNRIDLDNTRGVPLQVGAASLYPVMAAVVAPEEVEVGGLRNKAV